MSVSSPLCQSLGGDLSARKSEVREMHGDVRSSADIRLGAVNPFFMFAARESQCLEGVSER